MATTSMPPRPAVFDLVVDSSALISILLREATAAVVREMLDSSAMPVMSAASVMESSIVAESTAGRAGGIDLDRIISGASIAVLPVDSHQLVRARDAWRRFGRGRHRARLNFGDCFSYALASHLDVPLLAVGDDFIHTDLRVLPVR